MPYKSKAQAAYFNIHRKELESQGVDVDEWNESSKGKKLPKKAEDYSAPAPSDYSLFPSQGGGFENLLGDKANQDELHPYIAALDAYNATKKIEKEQEFLNLREANRKRNAELAWGKGHPFTQPNVPVPQTQPTAPSTPQISSTAGPAAQFLPVQDVSPETYKNAFKPASRPVITGPDVKPLPSTPAAAPTAPEMPKMAEITLDIAKGDTLLGGRFKNQPIEVEEIGTDELGQPTVNGRKLLAYRIKKNMPKHAAALFGVLLLNKMK
jgi:hypothetical protein